jgi:hypothetical protein
MTLLSNIIKSSEENSKDQIYKNNFFTLDDKTLTEQHRILSYTGFCDQSTSKKMVKVSHEKLFGAKRFKEISGIDLPNELVEWFLENKYFLYIQYPVYKSYNSEDWRFSRAEMLHPERMALIIKNKWNKEHTFYHNQNSYEFNKEQLIPIAYMGDGFYISYYYGKEKEIGIYLGIYKIASTYREFIEKFCENPDYYDTIVLI